MCSGKKNKKHRVGLNIPAGISRLWEQLNNPNFKGVEFDTLRKQTILNNFNLTPQKYKTTF